MASRDELEAMGISRNSNTVSNNSKSSNKNSVASIIKGLSILEIICGVIIGLMMIDEFGIAIIVATMISGIFIYALGEIIQLLEDIKKQIIKN